MFYPPHQHIDRDLLKKKKLPLKVLGTADQLWGSKRHDPLTDFNLKFEEVHLKGRDGGVLNGWLVPQQSSSEGTK